jgi:hypothetical protein
MAPTKPKAEPKPGKVKVQVGYSRPAPGALLKKGKVK